VKLYEASTIVDLVNRVKADRLPKCRICGHRHNLIQRIGDVLVVACKCGHGSYQNGQSWQDGETSSLLAH